MNKEHICRIHGKLEEADIYFYKYKNKNKSNCKICTSKNRKRRRERKKIDFQLNGLNKNLEMTCRNCGDLEEKDIGVSNIGELYCIRCLRASTKKTAEKYISGELVKSIMYCNKHGRLEKNEIYICKNGGATCKVCSYEKNMRLKHGMHIDEYNQLLIDQNYCCKICNKPNIQNKRLFIDHCHATGNNRKLLCMNCNAMLGQAKDNPEILRAGAIYLETLGVKHVMVQ